MVLGVSNKPVCLWKDNISRTGQLCFIIIMNPLKQRHNNSSGTISGKPPVRFNSMELEGLSSEKEPVGWGVGSWQSGDGLSPWMENDHTVAEPELNPANENFDMFVVHRNIFIHML